MAAFVADLEGVLAPDRLAPYRPTGGTDLAMLANYFWNVRLSAELYPILNSVEIALRNRLHQALTFQTGGQADWFDRIALLPRQRAAVQDAKDKISAAGRPITPGRVVAELDFGFWTAMLSGGYGAIWNPDSFALVSHAFPHVPATRLSRGYVHRRFNTLRLLRNRVSHHEPVWRGLRLQSGRLEPLQLLYQEALEAVGWASQRARSSTEHFERFGAELLRGRVEIGNELRAYLEL